MAQGVVTFARGKPGGSFDWVSNDPRTGGLTIGLCRGCRMRCSGPPVGFQGGPLEVELELRRRIGMFGFTGSKFYIAHAVRRPQAEVRPGVLLQRFGSAINAFLYSNPMDSSQSFLIDCGVSPGEELEGEGDIKSRELSEGLRLKWPKIKAVVLSHAHLDHWNLLRLKPRGIPVYCSQLVQQFLEIQARFEPEWRDVMRDVMVVDSKSSFRIWSPPLPEIRAFRVPHSVPEAMGFSFKLGDKKIVHLSEFKVQSLDARDRLSLLCHLRVLGDAGVDLLVLDTINIKTPGFTPSEEPVLENLGNLLYEIPGRVAVTMFGSNLQRVGGLVELASIAGKTCLFVGAGMRKAQELVGYPVLTREAKDLLAWERQLLLISGCQGEINSALVQEAEAARGRSIGLGSDDTLIFSSRAIPGNEDMVRSCIRRFQSRGVRVIVNTGETERLGLSGVEESLVHASGHASQEDVKLALQLLKPKCVIPVPSSNGHAEKLRELAGSDIRVITDSTVTL